LWFLYFSNHEISPLTYWWNLSGILVLCKLQPKFKKKNIDIILSLTTSNLSIWVNWNFTPRSDLVKAYIDYTSCFIFWMQKIASLLQLLLNLLRQCPCSLYLLHVSISGQ